MGAPTTVWFLVGNEGMGYGVHYWGLYRDYYKDPFTHSLLSTETRRAPTPEAQVLFTRL